MTGKEILLTTLRGEKAERVPWVPFVGVHGGSLIGMDATAYSRDGGAIAKGLKTAAGRYGADGLPVVFDLQLEAEILGCELQWSDNSPPSVATHPLGEDYNLDALQAFGTDKGRLPQVLEATRLVKQELGEAVALYGLLCGPLTLGLHLRGDDMLLDMFDEEEAIPVLFDYCAGIACQMADAYLEAGADIIAVVDPMVSQIGPGHFADYVAPPLDRIFSHVRARRGLSSLFVCGNATRNLEAMAATACDNISVDENVDLAALARTARAAGKSFGGNMQLTTVLLHGDENDVRRDAVRCLDEAGDGGGFVLAPGCDLPYATPPANLAVAGELVRDPYQVDVARALPPKDDDPYDDVTIPDYTREQDVIVDVVTLDSATCAACTYLFGAAREAARAFGEGVEVREHKIATREGIGYMKKLGVSAIPSICVDGEPRYASIIPKRDELVEAIRRAAEAKPG